MLVDDNNNTASLISSKGANMPNIVIQASETKDQPVTRKVQFSSSVSVTEIPIQSSDKDTYNEATFASVMWYTLDEMFCMCKSVLTNVKDVSLLHSYCIDEYAYNTPSDPYTKKWQEEANKDVLLQQDLLWDDEIEDPASIAEVYMETTCLSQQEATQGGIQHARHVSTILTEEANSKDEVKINLLSDKETVKICTNHCNGMDENQNNAESHHAKPTVQVVTTDDTNHNETISVSL